MKKRTEKTHTKRTLSAVREAEFVVQFGGLSTPSAGIRIGASLIRPFDSLQPNDLRALFTNALLEMTVWLDAYAGSDAAGQSVLSDEWEEEPKVLRATCNRWTDSLQRATLSLVVSDLPIVEMFRFVRKRAKVHVKRIGDAKEVNSEPAGSRMNEVESQL